MPGGGQLRGELGHGLVPHGADPGQLPVPFLLGAFGPGLLERFPFLDQRLEAGPFEPALRQRVEGRRAEPGFFGVQELAPPPLGDRRENATTWTVTKKWIDERRSSKENK